MDTLLFLCHRIPYPPNKGDKVRAFHLLRFLAQRYRVYLGTFVDREEDWQYRAYLTQLCGGECHFVRLNPRLAKIYALLGFLNRQPLTLPYYRNRSMQRWVDGILEKEAVKCIVLYSSPMGQYVMDRMEYRRIMDFVDVDSQKWYQYAMGCRGISRWIYRREAEKLLHFERQVAKTFDQVTLVSEKEADLFRLLAPESDQTIGFWENGVNADYFSKDRIYSTPYQPGDHVLIFTGAMDYWANVDAVCWFSESVFPLVYEKNPKARFVIAGNRPTEAVINLGEHPGVWVVGGVPDMRPYLAYATLAVVPMRIAQGIQNKILEAFAMSLPVVATSKAMEGVRLTSNLKTWIADKPEDMAQKVIQLLSEEEGKTLRKSCGLEGRDVVVKQYNWEKNLQRIETMVEGDSAQP